MSKQTKLQPPENPIVLGKLGAAYGIRGWLKVFRPPNMLKVFLSISLGLSNVQVNGNTLKLKIGNIITRISLSS